MIEQKVGDNYYIRRYEVEDIFTSPLPSRKIFNYKIKGSGSLSLVTVKDLLKLNLIEAIQLPLDNEWYVLPILH